MLHVREMTEQDLPVLRRIYLESRIETFGWLDTDKFELTDFDQDTDEEIILVAEINGDPIGFISLYVPDSFIHCLFIAPTFEGKGAGRKLLEAAKNYLSLPMKLKCLSRNTNALSFYKNEGWKLVGEVIDTDNYWNLIYDEQNSFSV